jgi:hypothetical protein
MDKFNKYLVLVLGLFFVFSLLSFKQWKVNILGGDSWGYYSYLPSTFIYHDVGDYTKTVIATQRYDQNFVDPLLDKYGLYHTHPTTKKNVIKYTSGLAILLSPFFLIAHFLASIFDYKNDGFSEIYRICMALGMICWVLLGLYYLLALLREYFSKPVAAATIIAISLCTNLYYNTAYSSIMSHALLFALYSLLLYATHRFYQGPSAKRSIILGLLCGFITLTIMTELYCILIPLLWNFTSIRERFSFIATNVKNVMIAIGFFALPFSFQIFYWLSLTGSFVFNGYVGESFHFNDPQIMYGLFNFDNGWLPWSPIMILALLGIFLLRKHVSSVFLMTIILVPLHIYIIYSWWCFNYINGFGSRPMEHLYPLLSFSMASFFCALFRFTLARYLLIFIISLTGILNVFQNYQISKGLLITSFSSPAYYYHMLGALKSNSSILVARSSKEFQPTSTHLVSKILGANDNIDTIKQVEYSEQSTILYTFDAQKLENGDYVKINFRSMYPKGTPSYGAIWDTPFFYVQWRDKDGKNIRSYDSGVFPFQFCGNPDYSIYSHGSPDVWGDVSFYVKVPKGKMTNGVVGIWNPNKTKFYIDDLHIELHN